MSDALKHECGIGHIRLLKPLEFYKKKYGSAFYGINKNVLVNGKTTQSWPRWCWLCEYKT